MLRFGELLAISESGAIDLLRRYAAAGGVDARGGDGAFDVRPRSTLAVRDGVGTINIHGALFPRVANYERVVYGVADYADVELSMAAALADPAVRSIVLDLYSPGGSVLGLEAAASSIAAARGVKPVVAMVSEFAASAAYRLAVEADRIVGGPGALVGSIGTISSVSDFSALADKLGIKVTTIRSHELKGTAIGDHVPKAQYADAQRLVDTYAASFKRAVAARRPVAIDKVATGQVWPAEEAVGLGLIDAVGTAAGAAAPATEGAAVASANERFEAAVREAQARRPGMSWDTASMLVKNEQPALYREALVEPVEPAAVRRQAKAPEFRATTFDGLVDEMQRESGMGYTVAYEAAKRSRPDLWREAVATS